MDRPKVIDVCQSCGGEGKRAMFGDRKLHPCLRCNEKGYVVRFMYNQELLEYLMRVVGDNIGVDPQIKDIRSEADKVKNPLREAY